MDVLEEAKGLLAKAQGEAHPMAWHVPEPLLTALVRELEAARAVVESWREAEPPLCRWQEAMHRDACAEAGRGLCSGCRTIAALKAYDSAAKAGKAVE